MKTTLTLLLTLVLVASSHGGVLPNDALVDGKTIGEWSAEWWKWIYSIPIAQNPDLDTNGTFAAVGQPDGSVFFVAHELGIVPGTYTRTFTVPEGKYLFLPLELYEADNVDSVIFSVEDLRAQAAAIVDDVQELHANLDGVDIPNLFDHRAISPVFNIFYTNADNIHTVVFGHPVTGLIDPMVCDGYWLMIEPLAPGPHVLHFGGSYSNAFFFKADVLDYITVVPANHPPVADDSATALRVISPDGLNAKVTLDGSRSSDPDNDPLNYEWLEGASVLSMASVSTNVLSVGTHVISLVVSDGKASATNTIIVNVITVEEAIHELASMVVNAGLPGKTKRPLLDDLEDAGKAFQRGHLDRGAHQLKEFQKEVREHVARINSAIAQDLSQAAQEIIDAIAQPPAHPTGVLPNNAIVDGKTIEDWSAEWWKWVFSIPTNQNPELDLDGSSANNGQPPGDVFFLGAVVGFSGLATRTFSVPEEKYLFFPLLNVWVDNIYTDPPLSVEALREIAASYSDSVNNLSVTVDDISLPDLFAHRAISPVFSFLFATPDNIASYVAGQPVTGLDDPIVSDGYWLMLEPLSPGRHVISFGGTYGSPFNFGLNITDTITVVAIPLRQRIAGLISSVEASSLSQKRQLELIEELSEAGQAFDRNHLHQGIEELGEFQKKVRKEVAPSDLALADQLIQAAQTIIDRVKAQLP